jgi:hypothetical protein
VLPDRETWRADAERRRAERATRVRPFPGLAAAASGGTLTASELDAALAGLPAARVALVPARRPAHVLAAVGWSVFDEGGSGVRVQGWYSGYLDDLFRLVAWGHVPATKPGRRGWRFRHHGGWGGPAGVAGRCGAQSPALDRRRPGSVR